MNARPTFCLACVLALGALAACGREGSPSAAPATAPTDVPTTSASGSASVALATSAAPASDGSSSSAAAAPSAKKTFPIVAGASCAGHGRQVSDKASAATFNRAGDTWSANASWGCGCPSGPVFTLVYEPKSSPLRVRLCEDQSLDKCEMICQSHLDWDLSTPIKDAGAKDVSFVDP